MTEKFPIPKAEKRLDGQAELQRQLLAGEIAASVFLERVFELDQSTPMRDEASHNIELLTDPVIVQKIGEDQDAQTEYHNLLSLSYFHIGQLKLMQSPKDASAPLEAALVAAEKITDPDYEDWKSYIRATIAYCKKDISHLEETCAQLKEGTNKQIVSNLLKGLKTHGDVDYTRDYRSETS